jgi:hypothetical protein
MKPKLVMLQERVRLCLAQGIRSLPALRVRRKGVLAHGKGQERRKGQRKKRNNTERKKEGEGKGKGQGGEGQGEGQEDGAGKANHTNATPRAPHTHTHTHTDDCGVLLQCEIRMHRDDSACQRKDGLLDAHDSEERGDGSGDEDTPPVPVVETSGSRDGGGVIICSAPELHKPEEGSDQDEDPKHNLRDADLRWRYEREIQNK